MKKQKRLYLILGCLLHDINALNIYISKNYPKFFLGKQKSVVYLLHFIKQVHSQTSLCLSFNRMKDQVCKAHNIDPKIAESDATVEKYTILYDKAEEAYKSMKQEGFVDQFRAELKYAEEEYIRARRMDIAQTEHEMVKTSCFAYAVKNQQCEKCRLKFHCFGAKKKEIEALEYVQFFREEEEEALRQILRDEINVREYNYDSDISERKKRHKKKYLFKRRGGTDAIMGLPTSLPTLDKWTDGLQRAKAWAIAARTGKGKTALAQQIAMNIWANTNWNILYLNLEVYIDEFEDRLDSARTNMPFAKVLKGSWDSDEEYKEFIRRLNEDNTKRTNEFKILDVPRLSMGEMRYHIRRHYNRWGSNFVVILDNLNRMTYHGTNETKAANDITVEFHSCTKEFNIPGLFLCQLNRDAENETKIYAKHFRDCDKIPDHLDAAFAIVGNMMNPSLVLVKGRGFVGDHIRLQNRLDVMRFVEMPKMSAEAPLDEDEYDFI